MFAHQETCTGTAPESPVWKRKLTQEDGKANASFARSNNFLFGRDLFEASDFDEVG